MIHIATAHRGGRWVEVQLEYFRRHLHEPHKVWASVENVPAAQAALFDVAHPMLGGHAGKLNLLWALVDAAAAPDDILIFCDSDAFPIVELMPNVRAALAETPLVAVKRVEDDGDPQPHPSFAAATVEEWRRIGCDWSAGHLWRAASGDLVTDVGSNLLYRLESRGIPWTPLYRSNTTNLHPIWFGIYGGFVYHHGAGSRRYPLSRPELVDLAYHDSGPHLVRRALDVPVAVRRRLQMRENRRLSAAVFEELRADPQFYKQFLETPAGS